MPRFNINHYVYVKLTDKGREMHKAYWGPFSNGDYRPPDESFDGWAKFQLHEVMNVFGPACVNGGDVPFETEIIIESERPLIAAAKELT